MPSNYSSRLRLELIADGEQVDTWGSTTNRNLGTLLEQSIAGSANVFLLDADYTLTALNGNEDESRNAILAISGTAAAIRNVIIPAVTKLYVVSNRSVGGQSVRVKTVGGSAVTVPNGVTAQVYCDGFDTTLVASNQTSATGTVTQINTGVGLTGGPITGSGTIAMAPSGVVAGSYGSTTIVPVITVNNLGQITAVSQATIAGGGAATNSITNTGGTITCTSSGITITSGGTIDVNSTGTFALTGAMTISKTLSVTGAVSFNSTSTMTMNTASIATGGVTRFGTSSQIFKVGSDSASDNRVLISTSGTNVRGMMWDGVAVIVGRGVPGGSQNTMAFQTSDTSTSGTVAFTATTIYKPSGGSFTATSDERLKDIHGPYSNGVQALLQLEPIFYSFKDKPEAVYAGLSAQKVLKTGFASMVHEGEDGYFRMDGSELVYALVNAVKELNSRLLQLEKA